MTVTEEVRAAARSKFTQCPSCGRPTTSMDKAAKDIGTTYLTLKNFLDGKNVNSETLDKIATWANGKVK